MTCVQAEVDKQDDMLDFSKTDAYRSTKTKEAEGRTKASTDQKEPSQDGQYMASSGMILCMVPFMKIACSCPCARNCFISRQAAMPFALQLGLFIGRHNTAEAKSVGIRQSASRRQGNTASRCHLAHAERCRSAPCRCWEVRE